MRLSKDKLFRTPFLPFLSGKNLLGIGSVLIALPEDKTNSLIKGGINLLASPSEEIKTVSPWVTAIPSVSISPGEKL